MQKSWRNRTRRTRTHKQEEEVRIPTGILLVIRVQWQSLNISVWCSWLDLLTPPPISYDLMTLKFNSVWFNITVATLIDCFRVTFCAVKPKFHYADFSEISPRHMLRGSFGVSDRRDMSRWFEKFPRKVGNKIASGKRGRRRRSGQINGRGVARNLFFFWGGGISFFLGEGYKTVE